MDRMLNEKAILLKEIEKLHKRYALSKTVTPYYYEPGMMEYLEHSYGSFDEDTGELIMKFEAKGTRYEGRTERIEKVKLGDEVQIVRDSENVFNPNNFAILTPKGISLGHMPAELCNAIAPLYDKELLTFERASVSYVEPISKRSRHAKQAVLFVEMRGILST